MSIIQSALEGLQRAEASLDRTASRVARLPMSLSGPPEDVVDLSAEAVALMTAKNTYSANLKVLEAGAELQQSAVDILG